MKLRVFAVSLLFSFQVYASEKVAFYDATLRDVVEFSASVLKKSVVVGADISQAPVSMFATYDTPAQLEALLQESVVSAGFYFSSSGGTIRISKDAIPEPVTLETRLFQLRYLQSDYATQSVRDVMSAQQSKDQTGTAATNVTPSPTSNAIIVTGTSRQLDSVAKVLREIDKPRRQVVITAVVAELTDDDYDALGLNVGAGASRLEVSGTALRQSDVSELGFALTFNGPTLSAFLQAVKSTGRNKILSTPQLLTLNREAATIVVGQNVPFITGSTTSASTPAADPYQTIVRQDVGITLSVTPFITPLGTIELKVEQTASSVSDDRTAADIITNTRRIATNVQLKDGQGVVLGGLRGRTQATSQSRVPLLSDIPGIGRLFRYTSRRDQQTNLVVLLTARIQGDLDAVRGVADPIRGLIPDNLNDDLTTRPAPVEPVQVQAYPAPRR